MAELVDLEPQLRLAAFISLFVLMAGWEIAAPRRPLSINKTYRWANNLGLVIVNSLLVQALFPTAAVGVALFAQSRGWGLFNWLEWPGGVTVILAIVLLDFAIWGQHLLFHVVPVLWRLHRVHHTDLDLDVTSGLRFHPIEILLSMVIKAGIIVLLGPPAVAVLLFEILLNATSMFNHGNVRMPLAVDRVLRWVIVTPDMHRVHHSWIPQETNSNYGFNLTWWDRLLGTYRPQPQEGHLAMTIGVKQFRNRSGLRLDRLLVQPLAGDDQSPLPGNLS